MIEIGSTTMKITTNCVYIPWEWFLNCFSSVKKKKNSQNFAFLKFVSHRSSSSPVAQATYRLTFGHKYIRPSIILSSYLCFQAGRVSPYALCINKMSLSANCVVSQSTDSLLALCPHVSHSTENILLQKKR